jgi:hypothetical protein
MFEYTALAIRWACLLPIVVQPTLQATKENNAIQNARRITVIIVDKQFPERTVSD